MISASYYFVQHTSPCLLLLPVSASGKLCLQV